MTKIAPLLSLFVCKPELWHTHTHAHRSTHASVSWSVEYESAFPFTFTHFLDSHNNLNENTSYMKNKNTFKIPQIFFSFG